MIRIAHIITGLQLGGAEMTLYRLLAARSDAAQSSRVYCLGREGPVGAKIRELGVPVTVLGLRRSPRAVVAIIALALHLRRFSPDVVQTWMYHSDLAGGLAAKIGGKFPVIWNLRTHGAARHEFRTLTRLAIRASAHLSHVLPHKVIACSEAASAAHVVAGYDPHRIVIIPNGYDLTLFRPDEDARSQVREELGVSNNTPLIGLVARFHPMKDHGNFVRAAALLAEQVPTVRFVLAGPDIERSNNELAAMIERAGISDSVFLLGPRSDIARVNAAMDIATSSSTTEGFPNSVGEAMGCGIPCVVTDVGESAALVGDCGYVVPPKDPTAMAGAWLKLLNSAAEERRKIGAAGRRRIELNFSISTMVRRYYELYESTTGKSGDLK